MDLRLGGTQIKDIRRGVLQVNKVYRGLQQVYPAATSGTFNENLIYDEVFYLQGLSDDTAFFSSMRTNNSIPCSTDWADRGVIYANNNYKSWWWISNELKELDGGSRMRPWMITDIRSIRTYNTGWSESGSVNQVRWMTYDEGTASVEELKPTLSINSSLGATNGTYTLRARDYDMLADSTFTDVEKRRFILNGCTVQLNLQEVSSAAAGIQTMTVDLDFDWDLTLPTQNSNVVSAQDLVYSTTFANIGGNFQQVKKWTTAQFSTLSGEDMPFTKDRWEGDVYDDIYFEVEDQGVNGKTILRMVTRTDKQNTTNTGQNQGFTQLDFRVNAAANWNQNQYSFLRTDATFSTVSINNYTEDRWEWEYDNNSGGPPWGTNVLLGDWKLRPYNATNNNGTRIIV